ncbi:unnamed protein product [Danaus chrysippus]|uniref:(African queen) hypothetical protein n=1 Tax=Danaus chrysippus TaxID=151541 RepID=A0A8J2W3A7_9NEOP|nr:unnamed protein product [Danaus chrysippus]
MVAVGIDLGTSSSCVAVWKNGAIEVIPNEQGNKTTPSYVAFTASGRLVGESAKNQASLNATNTIYGAKRLIGRKYDNIGLQMDLRHFPYEVINKNGKPRIIVNYKGRKCFAPEEISAMILFRMKGLAELWLGCSVDKAVVTVPAYFNDSQRQATKLAGRIAGLEVIRIINEPTAAAFAYGLHKNIKSDRNILVYDFGGGTFDVSILKIGKGCVYEVKATAGNTRLGGEDIDNRLVAYFLEDIRKRYKTEINSARSMRRLKFAAEKAKKALTSSNNAEVFIEGLCGINYIGKISRVTYEHLCLDLFKDTLKPIDQALVDAGMTKNDLHEVILVGGSTRIPIVKRILKEYFGRKISSSINPDEAVACGAAIQAAVLSGDTHERIQELLLVDVVPLSLGLETARGLMYKVIERNTPIPCRVVKEITTLEDYQNAMTIEIFEGERTLTKDNHCLGVFEMQNIPPVPRGVAKLDVIFEVDVNGILKVSAVDRTTGNSNSIIIENINRLHQNEVSRMISNADRFKEEDMENKIRLEVRNQLESYIYNVKRSVVENLDSLSGEEFRDMIGECKNALTWLDENQDCLREEYERKMTELLQRWSYDIRKLDAHRAKRHRGESVCDKTIIEELSEH